VDVTDRLSRIVCKQLPTYVRFQASDAEQMRTAPLWVITQRVMVISYRRFGTSSQVKSVDP
jgi:hypothetical protein